MHVRWWGGWIRKKQGKGTGLGLAVRINKELAEVLSVKEVLMKSFAKADVVQMVRKVLDECKSLGTA